MRKRSTVATYRSRLASQILPTFGATPLEAVTPSMIETWMTGVAGHCRETLLVRRSSSSLGAAGAATCAPVPWGVIALVGWSSVGGSTAALKGEQGWAAAGVRAKVTVALSF
jgi:hypothetical protein